ncbi:hypothetical protein BD626DRAFT_480109 [Schizophyllum amplum]|uniref:RRM domain-containing protein n=1 Tax=Schizophyllum amplum TaxID=97359 RepID=A0A550CSX5_9AGAR|nr:hypothetical protein BD626DRAFT_480109 [Auriculariopsis ampla]
MSSSSSSSSASSTPDRKLSQKRKLAEAEDDSSSEAGGSSSSPSSSGSDSDSSPPSDADSDSDSEFDDASDEDDAVMHDDGDDEAPALSHAERRRQKKKEKLEAKAAAAVEGSSTKKRKLENGDVAPPTAAATTKRQNSVWVGNMLFKTTQDDLRGFFKEAGEVTRINMPIKASGRPGGAQENRGYAYVDFATPEGKAAAIALSEQPLIGRRLLIKDGDDFAGRPAPPGQDLTQMTAKTHSKTARRILSMQKQPPAPTLFLGNLSFETTEDDIRQLFEAHRPAKDKAKKPEPGEQPKPWIRKVRMATFEDSGKCKGFAFVDFETKELAEEALINPKNHHLNGRALQVQFAGAEAVRRGAPHRAAEKDAEGRPAHVHKGKSAGYDRTKPKNPGSNKAAAKEASAQKREKQGKPSKEEVKEKRKVAAGLRGNWSRDGASREEGSGHVDVGGKDARKADKYAARDEGDNGWPKRDARPTRPMPQGRQRPGAALAGAQRQSAAIVPSQGKKLTF